MSKFDNQDLMSEFYQEIKDKYPEVDYNQIKDILFGSWMNLKQEMESGDLRDVRFEFFGVFRVYEKRVAGSHKMNKIKLEKGIMPLDKFNHYSNMYDTDVEGGRTSLKQSDRERSLQILMRINLLKRL